MSKTTPTWAELPAYQRRDALELIRKLAKTKRSFVHLVTDQAHQERTNDVADALEAAIAELDDRAMAQLRGDTFDQVLIDEIDDAQDGRR